MTDSLYQAAWIEKKGGKPLKVDKAPDVSPGANEIKIKNSAVAINPVDWKIQDYGIFLTHYPHVLGQDVAGTVVEVGKDVTRFKRGDRVISHTLGLKTGKPEHGAFQTYSIGFETATALLPSNIPFDAGAVLPLAISTAAAGLYMKDFLRLPLPTHNPQPHQSNKCILVYGASSSVGSLAVQFALASGLRVIGTASAANQEYVRSLGATECLDYHSGSVVEDLVAAIKDNGSFAGVYDAISTEPTIRLCAEVVEKLGGGFVAATLPLPSGDLPKGVKAGMCYAVSIFDVEPDIAEAVWEKFVPDALKSGQLKAKPDPLVVGSGLQSVQKGFDKQKEGVSAAKVVITL